MLISLVSAKGAPGTTTTALGLALSWPRPVLLVDLDPRGGDVLWTFGQGRDTEGRSLLAAQMHSRNAPWVEAIWDNVVALSDEDGAQRWLLPGLNDPVEGGAIDWPGLALALAHLPGVDVIADCGPTQPGRTGPYPVWSASSLVGVVLRPTLAGTHAALGGAKILARELTATGMGHERLQSIVVGPGRPYSTKEVSESLSTVHAPVLGEVPWDPNGAEVLNMGGGGRRAARSKLLRGCGELANTLGSVVLQLDTPGHGTSLDENASLPGRSGVASMKIGR